MMDALAVPTANATLAHANEMIDYVQKDAEPSNRSSVIFMV